MFIYFVCAHLAPPISQYDTPALFFFVRVVGIYRTYEPEVRVKCR